MRVRYILKGLENFKETAPSTELSPLWVPLSSELPGGTSSLPLCSPLHPNLGCVKAESSQPHKEQLETALDTPLAGPTPQAW